MIATITRITCARPRTRRTGSDFAEIKFHAGFSVMPNTGQATTTRETAMSNFHLARVIFASAITSATISLAFTSPVYAQSAATGAAAQPGNGPTHRPSERADLKNLENHGYKPTATEPNYPD